MTDARETTKVIHDKVMRTSQGLFRVRVIEYEKKDVYKEVRTTKERIEEAN